MSKESLNVVGKSVARRDGLEHVTGKTIFVNDIHFPDMLYLKMVRSPVPHANILGMDFSESEKVPGFVRLLKKEGMDVTSHQIKTTIPANTIEFESLCSVKLPKSKVELWHFDFPHLYNCTVSLNKEDEMIHSLSDRFGVRQLKVEGTKLLLNGDLFI